MSDIVEEEKSDPSLTELRSFAQIEEFLSKYDVNATSKKRIRTLQALSNDDYERYKTNLIVSKSCKVSYGVYIAVGYSLTSNLEPLT
jgi:hypothetical protein